jgi:hypothetical protein
LDATGENLETNLANGTDPSGLFVKRWTQDADGQPPYAIQDATDIAGFRLTVADPPAAPPAASPAPVTTTAKKRCKRKKKHRAAVVAKKCKKTKRR